MAIVRFLGVLIGVLFVGLAAASPALSKPTSKTANQSANKPVIVEDIADSVIFFGSTPAERLVVVETKQQKKRMTSIVPVGNFRQSFTVVWAQKNLLSRDQIHSGSSAFLTAIAEFSSPRLAVYADANPCVKSDDAAADGKKPTMSVAGVPYVKEALSASVKVEFADSKNKNWTGLIRGLSVPEKALAKKLSSLGYGFVKATYTPPKVDKGVKESTAMPALQVAWEMDGDRRTMDVIGKSGFLLERFFFAASSVEQVLDKQIDSFPTGIELPYEVANLFPVFYRAWYGSLLKNDRAIRGYAGPVNRCDLCYERPPTKDVLSAAGVFWDTNTPPLNEAALRSKQATSTSTADTWLSRHLMQKQGQNKLSIQTSEVAAGVGQLFTEQGSVQKPFLGEIFCPAMDGYQAVLASRREKTMAALNGMAGMSEWNEKTLNSKTEEAGVVRPSWYQDHWQK